jgi:hypothetical protein
MSIGITWYTLEEAAAKYNLEKPLILKWIEDGVVRAETADKGEVRVNVDDLDLKLREMTVL